MAILQRVVLRGFKSIREMDLELRSLNILIGANGAGKSNLILFFKMLNEAMGGRLQLFVGNAGGAQSLLHFGPKVTQEIEASLHFENHGMHLYEMRLHFGAGDSLFFSQEEMGSFFAAKGPEGHVKLGEGHRETLLDEVAKASGVAAAIKQIFDGCRVFHFHDTSFTAAVRLRGQIHDNRRLKADAGNLAAFLYRLQNENGGVAYDRIVRTVRLIAPFFDDFDLAPSGEHRQDVLLNWRHVASSELFGPHQLSDGTLRAICLVALLLQPENELPDLIVVDEPELGLHPYALNVIASLFKKASQCSQVLVSTQSSAFLDNFEPEDIVVADRDDKESTFRRLEPVELADWLKDYSLGEIWEKNVIQGGPH